VLPKRAGVVSCNVVFARKSLLDAEEAGGGAVAMCASVLGSSDIAMVFVYGSHMRAATLSASEEGLRALAIWDGVTEVEATATLEEGRSILEGADCRLAAKEVGRRAFHKLEAVTVGVVKGENYTCMDFAGEVLLAAEPSGLGEDASAGAHSVFHEFGA
jgi:hypothetical protein